MVFLCSKITILNVRANWPSPRTLRVNENHTLAPSNWNKILSCEGEGDGNGNGSGKGHPTSQTVLNPMVTVNFGNTPFSLYNVE